MPAIKVIGNTVEAQPGAATHEPVCGIAISVDVRKLDTARGRWNLGIG